MSPRRTLLTVVAALIAATTVDAQAAVLTTAPQATHFDKVTLTDQKVTLLFSRVERGALVVFNVRNLGKRPRDLTLAGYKMPLLASGKSARFELNFQYRTTYTYVSSGPRGVKTVHGDFTVY